MRPKERPKVLSLPSLSLPPRTLSVKEGVRDHPAVALLISTICERDAEALATVGDQAFQLMLDETVCELKFGMTRFKCGMDIPVEVQVLAWAASTFAPRADELGDAEEINYAPAFAILPTPEPWYSRWGLASEGPPKLRYTAANAKRAIAVLRKAIAEGDGDSMVQVAAKAQQCYGRHLLHRSEALKIYNGAELRAYTWVAKILGERCQNGDFGSKMTPEEEAVVLRLKAIVERVHELAAEETMTPVETWSKQISSALEESKAKPAACDGLEPALSGRRHLKKVLSPLLQTLEADLAGCTTLVDVLALDKKITYDSSGDGDFNENDICENEVDLSSIYELEQAVAATSKLPLEARFVAEATKLLEQRRVERSLIEGIKEMNASDLQMALDEIDARREAGTPIGIIKELEPPARRVLLRLLLQGKLEDGVQARDKAVLTAAIDEADQMGAHVVSDLLRKNFDMALTSAKAMVEKLDQFAACQTAMDAKDVEGLQAAISAVTGAWYIQDHWEVSDQTQLKTYQLAYKRLTVLSELQKYMEPLNVAQLQGALNTAQQVKMVDPLVDKAIEILKNIDRETATGAFEKPFDSGGAYGGDEWLSNPHFRITFASRGEDAPSKAKISVTCAEGREGGDDEGDYFGAYAIHLVRNSNDYTNEAVPGFELIASTAYSTDTAIMTVDEVDCSQTYFLVPSTKIAGEEGPFTINVICETPHADLNLEPVEQVGDLVLQAIAADDLVELKRLLDMAKEKNLSRVHGAKGLKYLTRRTMEERIKSAIAANGPVEELATSLEGAQEAHVPPSLIERAEVLLAQLKAIVELKAADESGDWKRLEKAIADARSAKVDEPTIEPYLKSMRKLRASAKLRACIEAGEDGYPKLQANYDDAVEAQLDTDQGIKDIAEAKKLLEALANAQRFFQGTFDKWMGGGYDPSSLKDITSEVSAAETGLTKWVDNPQFRLVLGASVGTLKMSVSVDKASDATYEEYAVHIAKMSGKAGADAVQLGEDFEIVAQTEYKTDSDHEGSAATVKFVAEEGCAYFIVPSPKQPNSVGGFSVTTIGVGDYTLEPVGLVQVDLQNAMKSNAFEKLPELVARAESAVVDLAHHALVMRAKLISEIERGWQEKNAELMGEAMSNAKKAKVDKAVLKTYQARYKQLAIEGLLRAGLADNVGLLLAACEQAKLIGYEGDLLNQGEAALKKHGKFRHTEGALFIDDNAAGSRKFGSWRDNPAWKLKIKGGKKATVIVAINEDGELDNDAQAKLEAKSAKKEAAYQKARDKMAAAQAAAEADEKNDELAAAAKDAARVLRNLTMLDSVKRNEKQTVRRMLLRLSGFTSCKIRASARGFLAFLQATSIWALVNTAMTSHTSWSRSMRSQRAPAISSSFPLRSSPKRRVSSR